MSAQFLIGLLLASPLVGFLINGPRFRSKNAVLAGTIATSAAGVSFICSLVLFAQLLGLAPDQRSLEALFFTWIPVGALKVQAGFVVDQISAIMILIITGVGTLIHLFSIGYMSHDERPAKYFAYLNLFLFNMLILVLGDNLLMTFVGWEGVGLCSYLLIGFWFTDAQKAAAGMKAFIVNRIGDAGFLIGLFLLFFSFGTLDYSELSALVPQLAETSWLGPITLACLFLFIGATGKSAQIPLYVWLPDAMAGPTPVSALIHAATMVTAGVYLIVRMSALFMIAPYAMEVIAWTGALTALFAATIGMTQWDIKKILAYSTVSQLGFMFLAVGVGAFHAAMFHLMTHAFFKALMFLGSGSVIHSMHEEQDVRKMGGLAKVMPITHLTFFLGWLAIIGMPPFAGFFSKDEILAYAFFSPQGSPFLWAIGALAAVFTAFYMTRLMALTFWGKPRYGSEVHPHESPLTMTIPLMVLGFLSVVGGWIGIPHVIGAVLPGHPENHLLNWLKPMITNADLGHPSVLIEWGLMGFAVALAGIAAYVAYDFYVSHKDRPAKFAQSLGPVHGVVENKYYVDEGYFAFIVNPLIEGSKALWLYVDVNFIDKITYLATDLAQGLADFVKTLQNGKTQQYALYMTLGLVVVITYALMGS
ncbi:NADH-quinone oxidoreductase subunit L [bacterium]|nr:NADH-quinone oxidoreductase subunit L [bacterium]